MPNIYMEKYNSFNRLILEEVMSDEELRKLDLAYTQAKLIREKRRAEQAGARVEIFFKSKHGEDLSI